MKKYALKKRIAKKRLLIVYSTICGIHFVHIFERKSKYFNDMGFAEISTKHGISLYVVIFICLYKTIGCCSRLNALIRHSNCVLAEIYYIIITIIIFLSIFFCMVSFFILILLQSCCDTPFSRCCPCAAAHEKYHIICLPLTQYCAFTGQCCSAVSATF